jgi:hypothetical protein
MNMKKTIIFLLALLVPVILVAQQDTTGIEPPSDWGDILFNFPAFMSTFGGVALVTAFAAAFFNGLLHFEQGFKKQLVAWAVAIVLLVVTDLLNFGYAKDLPILLAVIHGFAAGLASNGVFDVPFLNTLLRKIELWFTKPVPPTQ